MLSIFQDKNYNPYTTKVYPEMIRMRTVLLRNAEQFMRHWHVQDWHVKGNHILINVLYRIKDIIYTDDISTYHAVSEQIQYVLSGLRFTDYYQYGKIQPVSHFYGKEVKELYHAVTFDDSVEEIVCKPYTDWTPIRVVSHPFTSFDYQIPNGYSRHEQREGVVVIKMDLALLYLQYLKWRHDRKRSTFDDGSMKNITNFLHSYPIVNMIPSHLERCWYNRVMYETLGLPIINYKPSTRFRLLDPYTDVDKVITRINEDISKNRGKFKEWLTMVPGIQASCLYEYIQGDSILRNQQNRLTLFLPCVDVVKWLLKQNQNHEGLNSSDVAELTKHLRTWLNNGTLSSIDGINGKALAQELQAFL